MRRCDHGISWISILSNLCITIQIADSGLNLNIIPVTDEINTSSTTTTYAHDNAVVTETVVTKTIHQTVHVSSPSAESSPNAVGTKRPHADGELKRRFDGELGSLVAWVEDTEQRIMSEDEPTPDTPDLDLQKAIYDVSKKKKNHHNYFTKEEEKNCLKFVFEYNNSLFGNPSWSRVAGAIEPIWNKIHLTCSILCFQYQV